MARHHTLQEQILTLLQTHTQKELAERYGVSTRAIRHWRDGDRNPSNPDVLQRINYQARQTRRQLKESGSYDSPVPVKTKRIKDTDYYTTRTLKDKYKFEILRSIRDAAKKRREKIKLVRFVIRIPKGTTSPGGREFKKSGYFSTAYQQIGGLSDVELWELFSKHNQHGSIHQIIEVGKPLKKGKKK